MSNTEQFMKGGYQKYPTPLAAAINKGRRKKRSQRSVKWSPKPLNKPILVHCDRDGQEELMTGNSKRMELQVKLWLLRNIHSIFPKGTPSSSEGSGKTGTYDLSVQGPLTQSLYQQR
jgi:hypothetical protein